MTTIHTKQLQQCKTATRKHKTTTTICTEQLQQYTKDNYNNTHKTTTIHSREIQYTQDNYNNTVKTTTTIHTAKPTIIERGMCTGQPPPECDDTRCCVIQF